MATAKLRLVVILGFITLLGVPLSANPFLIENITLVNGGTVTGGFNWDPSTGIYSNILISVSTDGPISAFVDHGPAPASPAGTVFSDGEVFMSFFTSLTNNPPGGVYDIFYESVTQGINSDEGACNHISCPGGGPDAYLLAVPEPSSATMMLLGALGLAGAVLVSDFRRRVKKAATAGDLTARIARDRPDVLE